MNADSRRYVSPMGLHPRATAYAPRRCKFAVSSSIRIYAVDYRTLENLRRSSPAWRLMLADHAPLILGFLYKTFIQPNVRSMSQPELASRLADHLYTLRELAGGDAFPKRSDQYLDDWASDDKGWLRKYYPPGHDEPEYDLTPATERVIDWVAA